MKTYEVTLIGKTPLLMHSDDVDWGDYIKNYLKIPGNKQKGSAGDDRFPAWKWVGYSYVNNGLFTIPADNLMTVLRQGGAKCSTGKGRETFKVLSQSGLIVNEIGWDLYVNGKTVPFEPFEKLIEHEKDFAVHEKLAQEYGFQLFKKRATVGKAKHVRVRPRFDNWSCQGTITVFDEDLISKSALDDILKMAGMFAGVGDWRPSAPQSPGRFGIFVHKLKEVK
jgi:hypothetical protein